MHFLQAVWHIFKSNVTENEELKKKILFQKLYNALKQNLIDAFAGVIFMWIPRYDSFKIYMIGFCNQTL